MINFLIFGSLKGVCTETYMMMLIVNKKSLAVMVDFLHYLKNNDNTKLQQILKKRSANNIAHSCQILHLLL